MASERMSNYNRNRFKVEHISSDTASPGRVVSVNLPENAIIDLKSLKFHMDVLTDSKTDGTNTVYGRIPQDAASLLSRCEISLNGQTLQEGCQEYNTLCRILKIGRSNRDKDASITRALSHGQISIADAVEDVSLVISEWPGFLNECSVRFMPVALLGQLSIRLTFADAAVIVPHEDGATTVGATLSGGAAALAPDLSYSVSNMFWTCDTVSFGDDAYENMLLQRLQREEFIPINYKHYYSFAQEGIASNKHSTRFSLAAGSIDKLYATIRRNDYTTKGIQAAPVTGASMSDSHVANYFKFKSYDSISTKQGSLRTNWNLNNVMMPQYSQGTLDELFNLAYCNDKVHDNSFGNLVTSLAGFNDALFVSSLLLNHPGEPVSCRSGYNSLGINTNILWNVSGAVLGGHTVSTYVVCETTAQLRVGLGKNSAVSW